MSNPDSAQGGEKRAQQRHPAPNAAYIADQIGQVTRSLICYDRKGAASILNLTIETVRRMIKRGELKAYQTGGRWRVPAWAIQEYQEEGARRALTGKPESVTARRTEVNRINLAKARAKFKADREHMKRFLDTAESPLPEQPHLK